MERLIKSAKMLRIPITWDINDLEAICNSMTELNESEFTEDDEYRLMIDVTRGLLPRYEQVGALGTNVIISVFPLKWATKGMGKYFDTGIDCFTPSQRQIPAQLLDPKIKHRSRMHFRMALNEGDWPLLLDPDGFISEGPGYNFFIIQDDFLYTPESRNILRGISRDYVMESDLCRECNMDLYDVYNADEAFITGTPFCMLPVVSLNDIPIGNGKVGDGYKKLLDIWSRSVGMDIKRQIQQWDEKHLTNIDNVCYNTSERGYCYEPNRKEIWKISSS